MEHPTRVIPYNSEALKNVESKGKDTNINSRKTYLKVCVNHKKKMNLLSKTDSEIFVAVNSDTKSGV